MAALRAERVIKSLIAYEKWRRRHVYHLEALYAYMKPEQLLFI